MGGPQETSWKLPVVILPVALDQPTASPTEEPAGVRITAPMAMSSGGITVMEDALTQVPFAGVVFSTPANTEVSRQVKTEWLSSRIACNGALVPDVTTLTAGPASAGLLRGRA